MHHPTVPDKLAHYLPFSTNFNFKSKLLFSLSCCNNRFFLRQWLRPRFHQNEGSAMSSKWRQFNVVNLHFAKYCRPVRLNLYNPSHRIRILSFTTLSRPISSPLSLIPILGPPSPYLSTGTPTPNTPASLADTARARESINSVSRQWTFPCPHCGDLLQGLTHAIGIWFRAFDAGACMNRIWWPPTWIIYPADTCYR